MDDGTGSVSGKEAWMTELPCERERSMNDGTGRVSGKEAWMTELQCEQEKAWAEYRQECGKRKIDSVTAGMKRIRTKTDRESRFRLRTNGRG